VLESEGEPQTYALLGATLLERLRETGDPGLYTRAETAFGEALERDPRSLDATVGLGTLALARHDFRTALRHGRAARRINPRSFAPFAVLVDALIELGRYGAAERALQQMIDFKPGLASYARVSYFRELHGDLDGAVRAMRLAASAAPSAGENRSYIQTLLGDLELQRGRIAAAAASYQMALAGFPGYAPAIAGLARVDAARGRLEPTIERLRGVAARLPLPEYVIALGEAELAAGRRGAAARDFELVRAEQRLLGRSGVNTDAELAVFEADHGSTRRALRLARRGYAAAPSVRSADALGWALTRAGRPRQGLAYARRALGLGSRDPHFLYHAGVAARAAGVPAAARAYLTRALVANPRFSPLHAPRALRALRGLR
jgi:tetratricopeptide (TPR) repeat protein